MRDKFLTEAVGECEKCGDTCPYSCMDFSTWAGFGKLWEWAQEQEWWQDFVDIEGVPGCYEEPNWLPVRIIHPDRFADALYAFLLDRQCTP